MGRVATSGIGSLSAQAAVDGVATELSACCAAAALRREQVMRKASVQVLMLSNILSMLLLGCATWSTSSVDTSNRQALGTLKPTTSEKVVVTEGDIADRPYVSLGDITVDVHKSSVYYPNPTRAHVNRKLQEKAAALGADAVIFVRYGEVGVTLLSMGSLEGKGRAIRFQPQP